MATPSISGSTNSVKLTVTYVSAAVSVNYVYPVPSISHVYASPTIYLDYNSKNRKFFDEINFSHNVTSELLNPWDQSGSQALNGAPLNSFVMGMNRVY